MKGEEDDAFLGVKVRFLLVDLMSTLLTLAEHSGHYHSLQPSQSLSIATAVLRLRKQKKQTHLASVSVQST